MNVLIVEDNNSSRKLISAHIEEMGHFVIAVNNGSEALTKYHDNYIDLVLMDVEMPGMNGFETTRRLREIEGDRWFPIVFLSAKDDPAHFVEGIDSGGDAYLTKPINGPVLRAMVRAMSRISQMHIALQEATKNMELLAHRDQLTGLTNRRGFDEAFAVECKLLQQRGGSLSCLMIDIDYFKQYNDHYGHIQGDKCLIRVAALLKESLIGNTDTIARYGGEEFSILIPNLQLEFVAKIAKRLCKTIFDANLLHAESSFKRVTISIGCSATSNTTDSKNSNLKDLVQRADKALYAAKNNGRNQVCSSA